MSLLKSRVVRGDHVIDIVTRLKTFVDIPSWFHCDVDSPSVTAEITVDADIEVAAVKIQTDTYELNVFLNADDIDSVLVTDLPIAPDEHAICAGECCGAPAHWARDNTGMMSIVIGCDDTTWDAGLWMPYSTFSTIKQMLTPLRSRLAGHNGG